MHLTRRQILELTVGTVALAGSGIVFNAAPAIGDGKTLAARTTALLDEFLAGNKPKPERVSLNVAELQENGFSVPITVNVDSPMTADDYVAEVIVLADRNPDPGVLRLAFTPMSGQATLTTRIRLARTQTLIAAAKMSDGSTYIDKKNIAVTVGGCGA
ncbi:MAG: thiosulfate oxidation carrier protein SoxY [Hyphomicrobiaceae bacterium]